MKNWYDDGLKVGNKKRKYTCSLCRKDTHTTNNFELRQVDSCDEAGDE